jgi:hypothetical protein
MQHTYVANLARNSPLLVLGAKPTAMFAMMSQRECLVQLLWGICGDFPNNL